MQCGYSSDCCINAAVDLLDQRRIAVAIEHSMVVAEPDDAPEFLLIALELENSQGALDIVSSGER